MVHLTSCSAFRREIPRGEGGGRRAVCAEPHVGIRVKIATKHAPTPPTTKHYHQCSNHEEQWRQQP